jgi:hypothetical protein
VIERQPTGGDDAMDMGVKFDLLIPGVQHAEEADLGTQMSGSASDFEESFCTGPKQQPVVRYRVCRVDGKEKRLRTPKVI